MNDLNMLLSCSGKTMSDPREHTHMTSAVGGGEGAGNSLKSGQSKQCCVNFIVYISCLMRQGVQKAKNFAVVISVWPPFLKEGRCRSGDSNRCCRGERRVNAGDRVARLPEFLISN